MTHLALVSGWQTVNIGDVAHTPGALAALRRFGPDDLKLTLWAHTLDDDARRLLDRYFGEVEVIEDRPGPDGELTPTLERLFAEADLLIHGSGPSLVARRQLAVWAERTTKPYGIFGVTVGLTYDPLRPYPTTLERAAAMIDAVEGDLLDPEERTLLDHASFVYCRETLSLRFLQGQEIATPALEFGPDATTIFDVVSDGHGVDFLTSYGLEPGRFLCAVPRQRFTPYFRIHGYAPEPEDLRKSAYSEAYLDSDLEVLRQAVIEWVRSTGQPAIIVPEMTYEVELAQRHLAGRFPADVADRVRILPRFWDLTEAAAVYRQAAAVVSMECHSPLIALAEGTPALYLRQPTDTIKGEMYADLGLADNVVELADGGPSAAIPPLAKIISDPAAARELMARARKRAHGRLRDMVDGAVRAAAGPRP